MARQKGLMKYVGTLGDVRHFKIKGQSGYFAGLVGGPTTGQVYTAEEFKRTRENMTEFAGCAQVGKAVRMAFSPLSHLYGAKLTGRLTAIMKRINLEDLSEARGQRAILVTQVPEPLEGLDFNQNISIASVLRVGFTLTPLAARIGSTLAFESFSPLTYVRTPSGATHFRIINAIAAISDYEYKASSKSYEPKVSVQNGVANFQYSTYLPVNADTGAISLEAKFPNDMEPEADVSVLNAVGIEFYQEVNGSYYPLVTDNALQLVEVF